VRSNLGAQCGSPETTASKCAVLGKDVGGEVKRGNVVLCGGERRLASCTPDETAGARDRDHA
jgi:hypothetical protein